MVELTDEEYALITDAVLMLEEAIQRVRELHKEDWSNTDEAFEDTPECGYCNELYPCDTIKALDGEQ